ncbi:hypothetical protein ABH940_005028 [Streptacidiphilus sp. BW17]
MSSLSPVPALPDAPTAVGSFAAIWSRALYPSARSGLTRDQLTLLLTPLAGQLRDALHQDRFDPRPARAIGSQLVRSHSDEPDALAQTLGVLDAYLLLYFPPPKEFSGPIARARSARLQHAVAAGFVEALRNG